MRKATPVLAALVFLITLALSPFCSAQTQLVGEWSGSLLVGGQNARILWHVVKSPEGNITSTFDNVDEGILGIKVKTLTLNGDDITAVIDDVIHPNGEDTPLVGTFVAKLSKGGNEATGTWTQSKPQEEPPLDLTLNRQQAAASPQVAAAALSDKPSSPERVTGDWHGTLSAGGAELHLVFHFAAGNDGTLSGTLDSVDQQANGIPITSATLKGSSLKLVVDAVHGTYEGTVSPDGTAIKGTWSQGMPLELNLERGALKLAEPKPAPPTPAPPAKE